MFTSKFIFFLANSTKQAIHHITTDSNERYYLLHIFNTKPKYYFIDAVNTIINNNPKRKDIINKKLKYNIPVINYGLRTDTYTALNAISHNF